MDEKQLTGIEIIEEYLIENGFDGLYADGYEYPDGCDCFLGKLMAARHCRLSHNCFPGVIHKAADGEEYIGPIVGAHKEGICREI